ncbi:MAG: competence/damage-inducible protein A [Verrucomicrobia bacterium]|nr:competence/damage-inducible protein A [Verrucomicrobiota bacterium]
MRVEIINTGTELMLGGTVNTHLAFIARELFPLGLRVQRQVTVPDGGAIRDAVRDTFGNADIVLVTGGLGPTTDDITRDIVAELLGLKLEHDEEIWRAIQERFARRGMKTNDRVKLQALHPREATVLWNPHGTAPGLHFPAIEERGTPHIFLLPGPPRELMPMVREKLVPILAALLPDGAQHEMRTFRVLGIGESFVEEAVGEALIAMGLEIGYCARPGEVDVRIIGAAPVLDRAATLVRERLGKWIFTSDERDLPEVVVEKLTALGKTIATAESCTGGFIANQLTNVPGASKVFLAGYVTYANSAKTAALGVDAALIAQHGAVSGPVARQMAEGALEKSGATFALATTGIAGPDGGTAEKPVGTVFIALAECGAETIMLPEKFITDRETFKLRVSQTALDLLLRYLDGRDGVAKQTT